MKIRSWCSIKLGGVDILLPGDWLEDELIPPARVVTYQAADFFRAKFSDQINRDLVKHSFSFTRTRNLGNGLTARYFGMDHMAALPLEPTDCVISGNDGGVWTLSRAVLSPIQPKIYAGCFTASYALTGGEYKTTTAGPSQTEFDLPEVPATPEPSNLIDEHGNRITDEEGNQIIGV